MPRVKVNIDKKELTDILEHVENNNSFNTRSDLAKAIAERISVDVTPAVILLRIKEFNLDPKTPVGQRGRPSGIKLSKTQRLAMNAGRRKNKSFDISEMRKEFPTTYTKLLDRVSKGSATSSIKAMCLSCVQFQKPEITNCTCISCPLYHLRPYQKKS